MEWIGENGRTKTFQLAFHKLFIWFLKLFIWLETFHLTWADRLELENIGLWLEQVHFSSSSTKSMLNMFMHSLNIELELERIWVGTWYWSNNPLNRSQWSSILGVEVEHWATFPFNRSRWPLNNQVQVPILSWLWKHLKTFQLFRWEWKANRLNKM